MSHSARVPVLALCVWVSALAGPAGASDDTALSEEGYRRAATEWHTAWRERPSIFSRKHADCIAAWQAGDEIRTRILATKPPEAFAAYHDALRAYLEVALAVSDECLLKPLGGPRWSALVVEAGRKSRAVAALVRRDRLKLPSRW